MEHSTYVLLHSMKKAFLIIINSWFNNNIGWKAIFCVFVLLSCEIVIEPMKIINMFIHKVWILILVQLYFCSLY